MTTKYLKFWGTRGSCSVSGPQYIEFGGNTSCLELRYDDQLLIFDAGTGIRPLGKALNNDKKIHLFLSHTHWDHAIGFPFFAPIYRPNAHISVYSPQGTTPLRDRLNTLFADDFFPIPFSQIKAHLEFHLLQVQKPIKIGPLTVSFHQTHHPSETYCFKIATPHETIGYVTDNEVDVPNQQSFIAFHKNVDYFIHETQYTKEEYQKKAGWGHSSIASVLELIAQVTPHNWFVTHHDPDHSDEALRSLALLARSELKKRNLDVPVRWLADGHILKLK